MSRGTTVPLPPVESTFFCQWLGTSDAEQFISKNLIPVCTAGLYWALMVNPSPKHTATSAPLQRVITNPNPPSWQSPRYLLASAALPIHHRIVQRRHKHRRRKATQGQRSAPCTRCVFACAQHGNACCGCSGGIGTCSFGWGGEGRAGGTRTAGQGPFGEVASGGRLPKRSQQQPLPKRTRRQGLATPVNRRPGYGVHGTADQRSTTQHLSTGPHHSTLDHHPRRQGFAKSPITPFRLLAFGAVPRNKAWIASP